MRILLERLQELPWWILGADLQTAKETLGKYLTPVVVQSIIVLTVTGWVLSNRNDQKLTDYEKLVDAKIEHLREERIMSENDLRRQMTDRTAFETQSAADRKEMREILNRIMTELLVHERASNPSKSKASREFTP